MKISRVVFYMFSKVPDVQIMSGICWNIQNVESSRYRHRLEDSFELFEVDNFYLFLHRDRTPWSESVVYISGWVQCSQRCR